MKKYFKLFFIMLKIGLFTFGGGYAMIAILENELVSDKKWIDKDELLDMVDIAESTPGPIAINAATYVGYKLYGFWGSLLVTPEICIPSFAIIIFVIIAAVAFVIKKATKKNAFPILLILTSALLGILLYSF